MAPAPRTPRILSCWGSRIIVGGRPPHQSGVLEGRTVSNGHYSKYRIDGSGDDVPGVSHQSPDTTRYLLNPPSNCGRLLRRRPTPQCLNSAARQASRTRLRRSRKPTRPSICRLSVLIHGLMPATTSSPTSGQVGSAAVRSTSISCPGKPICAMPSSVLAVVNAGPMAERVRRCQATPRIAALPLTT